MSITPEQRLLQIAEARERRRKAWTWTIVVALVIGIPVGLVVKHQQDEKREADLRFCQAFNTMTGGDRDDC